MREEKVSARGGGKEKFCPNGKGDASKKEEEETKFPFSLESRGKEGEGEAKRKERGGGGEDASSSSSSSSSEAIKVRDFIADTKTASPSPTLGYKRWLGGKEKKKTNFHIFRVFPLFLKRQQRWS